MMATPDDPHIFSNLKKSHGLLSDMMSIISKYDKEFPDSDVVDLKDLSVSESYGFLESLPSRQTVWKEEDEIGPVTKVTVDLKKSDIVPKSVLSATALDSFLEGVIEEETLLTHQLEDEEWEDINSTIEEEKEEKQGEDQENEVIDSSDDTLSIASGSVSVRNLSEDVTEIETDGKKVVEEESNETDELTTQDEISSMSLNASQSAVYVKKGQSQTEEEEFDNRYCPEGNLHRFHDRSYKDYPVDDHENDKITTDEVFHKEMRSDDQTRIESESDQMMRARTCFLGKRKRKPDGGDEGSPSKSSRVGVILSPRSGNTKIHSSPSSRFGLSPRSLPVDIGEMESPMRNTYVIPTTLPESPSSRMLIASWKSQLCIVSPSWNDPVRIPNDPVTPLHRGTPKRYFTKDSKGSSSYNIRTPTRSYHLGTPRDLYKSKQQPNVEGSPLAGKTFIIKEPHQRNADKIYSGRRSGDEESGEDEEGSSLLTHGTNDQEEAARYKDQKEEVGFLVTSGSSDEEGEATCEEAEEEARYKDQKEEGISLVTSGSSDEEGEATDEEEEEEKEEEARYKDQEEEGSSLVTSGSSDEEGEATYEKEEEEEDEEEGEESRYKDHKEEGISLVTSGSSDEEDEEEASSMMASDEYSRLRERSVNNQTDHLGDVEGKRHQSRLTERQERRMRKKNLNMTYVVHGGNYRRTKGHDRLKSEKQDSRETLQQAKRKESKDRNGRSTPTRREHQPWQSFLGSPLDQTKILNRKNIKRAGKCEIKLNRLASGTDPFEFHDAETLPKTFTPQHNSTMIARPLGVANNLHGSPRMLTSASGFKIRHSCVTQVRKDNSAKRLKERVLPQGIDNHNDSVLNVGEPTAKRKTRKTEQQNNRVDEVEEETLVRRKQMQPKSINHGDRDGRAVNRKSGGVPHNQSNCTKIFCLRCCHSPGK